MLKFRIPPYSPPRNAWRHQIHAVARAAERSAGIRYSASDRLEVQIQLYLGRTALAIHDVDNRTKDILDALQGRAGGSKRVRTLKPIIPNDNQVYRLVIEKSLPPRQSKGFGHVEIKPQITRQST